MIFYGILDLLAGPVMGDARYAITDANSVIATVFGNAEYTSGDDESSEEED